MIEKGQSLLSFLHITVHSYIYTYTLSIKVVAGNTNIWGYKILGFKFQCTILIFPKALLLQKLKALQIKENHVGRPHFSKNSPLQIHSPLRVKGLKAPGNKLIPRRENHWTFLSMMSPFCGWPSSLRRF